MPGVNLHFLVVVGLITVLRIYIVVPVFRFVPLALLIGSSSDAL